MPSTNKTQLGFNQWLGTDKPKREDFNEDNAQADALMKGKADLVDGKVKQEQLEIAAEQVNIAPIAGIDASTVQGALDKLMPYALPFAPELIGETAQGTPAYAKKQGWYIKLGKLIIFGLDVSLTSKTGIVGNVSIIGLPYPQNSAYKWSSCTYVALGLSKPIDGSVLMEIYNGKINIYFNPTSSGSLAPIRVTGETLTNTSSFYGVSGFYLTN